MKRLPTILATVFFLTTLFLIYFFVFKGNVIASEDNRVTIVLSKSNSDFALKEMRIFLESVQQINEGILTKDSSLVYKAARQSGGIVVEHTPENMMRSLPIGFKKLGFSVHDKFDEIADSIRAENNFDWAHKELNTLLNLCVTCHRSYKIETE